MNPEVDAASLNRTVLSDSSLPLPGSKFPEIPGYTLLGELGRGGMGIVYQAEQVTPRRTVAIKVLLHGEMAASGDRDRFRLEAESCASLQHPNILRILEVGETAAQLWFSMDFLPGGSLSDKLKEGPLPPKEAALLISRLAEGMAVAHQKGILHRDLKPQNILLDKTGNPCIADFGLVKRLDLPRQTLSGAIMGSPSYMSPEQAVGQVDLTEAVDIYGLGAILYECLTGKPPFRAATIQETLAQVSTNTPAPPRLLNSRIPHDLETICLKCLEKRSEDRYRSAAELAADLRSFLAGETIQATSLNLLQRVARTLEQTATGAEFAQWSSMFFALIPVMMLPGLFVSLAVWREWPWYIQQCIQTGSGLTFLAIGAYFRWGRFLPTTPQEHQLYSIWGGYFVSSFACAMSFQILLGDVSDFQMRVYTPINMLTALAFFATGSLWGWFYLIGLWFVLLGFIVAMEPNLGGISFSASWGVVLFLVGQRLRRLGKEHKVIP